MKKKKMGYQNIHQDLINRCMDGDQKAQFEIYKLYYKAMFNTSARIVNDTMEAEDIMQESFLKAFKKLNTYKGEVSFGAWLKRIVVNHSLDALKKRKVEFETSETIPDMPGEDETGKEEIVAEKLENIRLAMNKLADGYRVILSLYLLEGYDHDEIAEIMNISASTSRSQFTRARKKLLEQLQD
jgi:RNA polymerase sigma-70 factor (ECF subfamily)